MSDAPAPISRQNLIALLNEDLSREFQAVIAYVVYSQTLKGAHPFASKVRTKKAVQSCRVRKALSPKMSLRRP